MEPTNGQPDFDDLMAWQLNLARRVDELRSEILTRQTQLAGVEARLTLVTKLVEMEAGAKTDRPTRNNADVEQAAQSSPATPLAPSTTAGLEDAVEEILRTEGAPLHISSIREALGARGVAIPGRGDDANIIVRLRRFEDRFTRTARGTYGLAEWGLPELKTKPRRQRSGGTG